MPRFIDSGLIQVVFENPLCSLVGRKPMRTQSAWRFGTPERMNSTVRRLGVFFNEEPMNPGRVFSELIGLFGAGNQEGLGRSGPIDLTLILGFLLRKYRPS